METNQLRKFAQEARTVLLRGVRNRLLALGFDAKGNIAEEDRPVLGADHVVFMGRVINDVAFHRKWTALYDRIQDKGIQHVCEEAAYTWFNRLVAIRIMVKNGFADPVLEYQSDSLRIPRIVTDARRGILPQMSETDRSSLMELLEDDTKTNEQFALLVVNYCRYNPLLSACFGGVDDYTELLLPANILSEDGFVDMLNHTTFISDEDYSQSELIGWLYQFYISEKKDEVFASKEKVKAEDIPAATQIFTPNWIVKYMVQNTLGRIYLDNNPYVTDIREGMQYLVQPGSQAGAETVFHYEDIHGLTIADLACGSGHILNEAFDLLYAIYIEEGYNRRTAIEHIFRYNLLGIDLDPRARQLAMFALLMKACKRDPSFLDAHCLPRVLDMGVAREVRRLNRKEGLPALLNEFFAGAGKELLEETTAALALMEEADNLGSIMKFPLSEVTRTAIAMRTAEWKELGSAKEDIQTLLAAFEIILALTDKYAAIAMNPPYMGGGNMNAVLSNYVKKNYEDGKADLFAVFMQVAEERLADKGKYGMINMQSWMFLSSFEKLRTRLLDTMQIDSMLHLGPRTFDELSGEVVQNTAFVVTKHSPDSTGSYYRLVDGRSCGDKERMFLAGEHCYPHVSQQNFKKIPGCPVGYWVSRNLAKTFENGVSITNYIDSFQGIITGDNNKFLRLWSELEISKIALHKGNINEVSLNSTYWIPYNKGGNFRKWYGIQDMVVYWKNGPHDKTRGKEGFQQYYLKEYVAWSYTVNNSIAARYYPKGFLWDVRGSGIMDKGKKMLFYLQAFITSKVGFKIFRVNGSNLSCQVENILQLPIIYDENKKILVDSLVSQNISISRADWDAHETSWDFQENELLAVDEQTYEDNVYWMQEQHYKETGQWMCIDLAAPELGSLKWRMEQYKLKWERLFLQLHDNEEELNRQFIEIYGLQDELSPDVPPEEITILQQGELTFN